MNKQKPHPTNTNQARSWCPKLRAVRFGDKRDKRNKTRERQLKRALKYAS